LEIDQRMAKIGIEVQQAQLHVEMPDQSMEINWEPPKMTINHKSGDVDLNMDEFKSNLGLKNYDELIDDAASEAFTTAAEATKDIVNTAAFVGDVSIGGQNKVGEAAKNKMLEYIDTNTGRSSVPPNITMDGHPGSLEIEWTKGELSVDFEGGGMAEVYVEPPCSVEVQLAERPYVRVSLAEESIPPASGRKVSLQA